jgi:hypothetical protein
MCTGLIWICSATVGPIGEQDDELLCSLKENKLSIQKNNVLLGTKPQFLPHRKHISSPLQRSAF